jgi:hypothetical protein
LFEGFVGSKDNGAAFVTLADDLEEKVGSALVDFYSGRPRAVKAKL